VVLKNCTFASVGQMRFNENVGNNEPLVAGIGACGVWLLLNLNTVSSTSDLPRRHRSHLRLALQAFGGFAAALLGAAVVLYIYAFSSMVHPRLSGIERWTAILQKMFCTLNAIPTILGGLLSMAGLAVMVFSLQKSALRPWSFLIRSHKMQSDPIIDEIREVRQRVSEEFGNDPERLVKHYMELERAKYGDRLVKPRKPAPTPEPTGEN
jgi:hypothetical protein